jgi:hypothetical protein
MEGNRRAEQQTGDEETMEFHDFLKGDWAVPGKKVGL